MRLGRSAMHQQLIHINRPILRVPTLAIHLARETNTDGFKPNLETHLLPIIATQLGAAGNGGDAAGPSGAAKPSSSPQAGGPAIADKHAVPLVRLLCEELACKPDDVRLRRPRRRRWQRSAVHRKPTLGVGIMDADCGL